MLAKTAVVSFFIRAQVNMVFTISSVASFRGILVTSLIVPVTVASLVVRQINTQNIITVRAR